MLCEDCGRNRAVVHITQIGPDGKIEKNLCERCAAKYGEFLMENQKHRNVSMEQAFEGRLQCGGAGEAAAGEGDRARLPELRHELPRFPADRQDRLQRLLRDVPRQAQSRYCAASTGRALVARSHTARAARLR